MVILGFIETSPGLKITLTMMITMTGNERETVNDDGNTIQRLVTLFNVTLTSQRLRDVPRSPMDTLAHNPHGQLRR